MGDWLWKRLWTCRKADCRMNKQEEIFIIMFRDVQLKPLAAEFNGKMRLKFPQFLGDWASLPRDFIAVVCKSKR